MPVRSWTTVPFAAGVPGVSRHKATARVPHIAQRAPHRGHVSLARPGRGEDIFEVPCQRVTLLARKSPSVSRCSLGAEHVGVRDAGFPRYAEWAARPVWWCAPPAGVAGLGVLESPGNRHKGIIRHDKAASLPAKHGDSCLDLGVAMHGQDDRFDRKRICSGLNRGHEKLPLTGRSFRIEHQPRTLKARDGLLEQAKPLTTQGRIRLGKSGHVTAGAPQTSRQNRRPSDR
jgi:hypothetical protein